MHLVALLCPDPALKQALARFKSDRVDFYLHPIPEVRSLEKVAAALEPLDFAGMLVMAEALQREALTLASRSSLDAQEAEAADALTVTPGGLIAEYNLGRAVGAALHAARWNARGASAVVLGGGALARAVSRELSSLGVRHLSVVAKHRPSAEKVVAQLAASTAIDARAEADPVAKGLVARADLLVRVDPKLAVPPSLLGPHLSVVDLSPDPLSPLRQQAMHLGALCLGLRDVQAHQLALSLGHMLGGRLEVEAFAELFHSL
jgi:shikimate 5-dehydrogenase